MWNWARRILPEQNREMQIGRDRERKSKRAKRNLSMKKSVAISGEIVFYIACISSDASNHKERYRSKHTLTEPKSCNSKTTVRFFFRGCVSRMSSNMSFLFTSQNALIHFSSSFFFSLLLYFLNLLFSDAHCYRSVIWRLSYEFDSTLYRSLPAVRVKNKMYKKTVLCCEFECTLYILWLWSSDQSKWWEVERKQRATRAKRTETIRRRRRWKKQQQNTQN